MTGGEWNWLLDFFSVSRTVRDVVQVRCWCSRFACDVQDKGSGVGMSMRNFSGISGIRKLSERKWLVCLPARISKLQDIEDAGLHVVELVFALCSGNRKNQLGNSNM